MKQLLLMRHAKSSWRDKQLSDYERPLKRRGERAALQMGEHLQSQQIVPSHVISSAAARAQATAELVVSQFHDRPELKLREELYLALPKTIVRVIQETDDRYESIMVVGHNPGLEELVFQWSAEFVDFTTCAIAHYEFNIDRWSEFKLKMVQPYTNLWKPKELDPDSSETPNTTE